MTKMIPLIERNEQFARTYTPAPLGPPVAQVLIVACLDHRVDPAIILGLQPGDAVVIRNAGGRVTPAVIDDIAYLAYPPTSCSAARPPPAGCSKSRSSTTPNAAPASRRTPASGARPAAATGVPETALAASAVADPHTTVKADVERLLASPLLSPKVSVSGHVYDIATGRLTTAIDARRPQPTVGN